MDILKLDDNKLHKHEYLGTLEEQIELYFQAKKLEYFLIRSEYKLIKKKVEIITVSFTKQIQKSNESIRTSYEPIDFTACQKYCDQLLELKNKI